MPAAAVIPAPIAYTKFVAVKKLVVGSQVQAGGPARAGHCPCRSLPRSVAFLVRLLLRGTVVEACRAFFRVVFFALPGTCGRLRPSRCGVGGVGSWFSSRSPGGGQCSPALPLPAPLPAVLLTERPGRPASLL